MNVWEQLLIAFGGNAILLVVLGFLARSLLQTWLTKDVKKFEADLKASADSELERLKAELKAKGDISIEELKNHLQQTAFEHQVRFSKLHEKRAELIAELYSRIVELRIDGELFVAAQAGRQQGEILDQRPLLKAVSDFYDFFEKHRIYFPERVFTSVDHFIGPLRVAVVRTSVHVSMTPGSYDYAYGQGMVPDRDEAIRSAIEYLQNDMPAALNALQEEFRTILGVENQRSATPNR